MALLVISIELMSREVVDSCWMSISLLPGHSPVLRNASIALSLSLPENDDFLITSNRDKCARIEPLNRVNACLVPSQAKQDFWRCQRLLTFLFPRCLMEWIHHEDVVARSVGNEFGLRLIVHCLEHSVRVCGNHDILKACHTLLYSFHHRDWL